MAAFNLGGVLNWCTERDSETGCYGCGENKQMAYEQCRQTYFLKQQNQILQQQVATSSTNDQKIKDLESLNTDLQKITDQQNQQITQLIQSSEQAAHRIENLNLVNTILVAVLVVVACAFLVVKFMKRRGTNK